MRSDGAANALHSQLSQKSLRQNLPTTGVVQSSNSSLNKAMPAQIANIFTRRAHPVVNMRLLNLPSCYLQQTPSSSTKKGKRIARERQMLIDN